MKKPLNINNLLKNSDYIKNEEKVKTSFSLSKEELKILRKISLDEGSPMGGLILKLFKDNYPNYFNE